jgi:SAM-dependent methyltransferase
MDMWKFYDITHREHVVCNPTSHEKLARLVDLLRLPEGAKVVDIACGKGEFLMRLAEAYSIRGIGIDLSPFFTADAQTRMETRAPDADIVFREMDGVEFKPEKPQSFALASCLGASFVFGGYAATLEALSGMVGSGGWVVVGEPYWLCEPPEAYLESSGVARTDFGTHSGNVETGELRNLQMVYTIVSSQDDWDTYEGLQWYATAEYARSHQSDPDLRDLLTRVAKERALYLRWGRDTLGWAIYVFRQS